MFSDKMSLPQNFTSPEDYFEAIMEFFHDYPHLYNVMNTEVLVNDTFDHIDISGLDDVDDFDDLDLKQVEGNKFLSTFFERLSQFEPPNEEFQLPLLEEVHPRMCPKKAHEVELLVKEIAALCEENGCDVVADFGSGLGYLDQLLYDKTNLKVLGIESNTCHVRSAQAYQEIHHKNSLDNVKYLTHTIGKDSNEVLERALDDQFFGYQGFCIAGLHSCADLSIDAMNLFLNMHKAKALAIVPCCYHKMRFTRENYENFPLSTALKKTYEKYNGFHYLKVPFFRIAAQRVEFSEKIEDLVFNLMARAVLQVYACKNNYSIKRNKRKAVKLKEKNKDFSNYLSDAIKGFNFIDIDTKQKITVDFHEVNSIWQSLTPAILKKAAIFIKIQIFLQPVIENFILYDRLVYLRENGIQKCRLKKIFNNNISPRSKALIASK